MPNALKRRMLSRLTAVSLSGAIVAVSPGTGCYSAFAQMMSGAVRGGAVAPVSPVIPVNASLGSLSAPSTNLLPSASLVLPSISANPTLSPSTPLRVDRAAQPTALPATAPAARIEAARILSGARNVERNSEVEWTALPRAAAVQNAARASQAQAAAAVAAPENARSEKSALGTLSAAAKGLAKSLGVTFDGSRMFRGAASPMNAVQDGEGARPVPEAAIAALLDTMRHELKKGEAFTTDLEPTLADMAGMPREIVGHVVAELASRGYIAAMANGVRVFVDVPAASQGAHSAERSFFHQGVESLNTATMPSQAGALNSFKSAVDMYRISVANGNPAVKDELAQAEVMRLNAGLEFLRSYLKHISERGTDKEAQGNAREALKMLEGSYFGTDHYPDPLNAYAASWIRGITKTYRAQDETKPGAAALNKAIDQLVELATAFELKTEALPKEMQAGAEAAKKTPFPLIPTDDKKFENLNKFGSNLTAKAVQGKLSPLIGRKAEIRQMIKTLMRVEKNNPVVIGEKGVGKTKIVEGLAQMIANGEVPELAGVNIIKLDVTALVAGTQYRGQFEERLKGVMDEAKANKGKVLLFIDELHTIVGLGSASGSQDASQMLKEALSSGDMSLIGATTLEEYRKIEKDGALERRFNPIKLAEPTQAEAIDILEGTKARYEKKHGVTIPKATVEAAVKMAARYVKSRQLPDSALDLMDDASAEVALQNTEAKAAGKEGRTEVKVDDVAMEINLRTGIPAKDLSDDDLASLKQLPDDLKAKVIGQDHAVDAVAKAIRRGRLGYREEKAPIGTFMFLGPTGVGKTEFVRVLAKNQFGSEKNVVRIDMSEYQEKHSVSRLVGAPPGYVGHDDAGQLTEAVRRNPHTIILLDEIEKAAPEVLDVLLQVIEDGRLTDGQGRTVDFSNAIIVMTSNIGGSLAAERAQPKRRIGFIQDAPSTSLRVGAPEGASEDRTESYLTAFKAAVRPEFFNRIGKRRVVVFNELGAESMDKILDLRMAELSERMASKGMQVRLSDAARKYILDDAASAENRAYGARPLKQAVAHEVEDALVDGELDGAVKKGDAVLVDFDGMKLVVKKDPEAKITNMGGFGILGGFAAALGLSALPVGVTLTVAVAGIAAAVGYGIWKVASSYSGPSGRAQAPPTMRVWVTRAALLTAALLAADFALKGIFWSSGLYVYHHIVPTRAILMAAAIPLNFIFASWMLTLAHSQKAPLDGLRRFRERHPIIGGLIWGTLQILTFPVGVNDKRHAGDIAGRSPAVSKVLGVFVVAAAAVLAGTLGNGLEGLFNSKVIDFIPVGHGRANLADFLVFFGLPAAWMTLDFFGAVRKAVADRKPVSMNFAKFWALPVLGMLGLVLSSAVGGWTALPLPAIYAAMFSTLFGVGILGSQVYLQRRVAEMNDSFKNGEFQAMPSVPKFTAGYRVRRAVAAMLASLAALPLVGKWASQPKMGGKDYAALVERYKGRLPKVVITDYDDTFMDNSDGRGLVISEGRLKLLEDLKAAGVRVAFATNRPLDGGSYAMNHMLVSKMSPALRSDFILSTGGGAEVFKFAKDGSMPETPVFSGPTFTEAERKVVADIISAEAARLGVDMAQGRTDTKPYEHAWMYAMGLDAAKKAATPEAQWKAMVADRNAKITAVFAALEKGLKAANLEFAATLKFPPRDDLEPYIRLSKSTKAFAVKAILETVEAEGTKVYPDDVIMLGDDFTVPGYDSAMPKSLPAGTAIAVGQAADASIPNVHFLGGGPDATEKFLRDIIAK